MWTDQGIVDMVAVSRFLAGDRSVPLNPPEVLVAYQACAACEAFSVKEFERRTGENSKRLKKLPQPVPLRGSRLTLIPTRKAG